jgi:Tfp pilus assembly protein FimV
MFAITAVAAAVLLSMFSLFGASAAADGSAGRFAAPKYVVAQPGDTLWSIGERIAPNAPISEVVDHLVRLNGTAITSGQLIRIP